MDKDNLSKLIQLGRTNEGVQKAQNLAKKDMKDAGYGSTLHNACAATLSEFMNLAGINVPITLGAGKLASRVMHRGWDTINVGNQHAGDVAVAKSNVHIFLVVKAIDNDVMLIADNQAPGPHRRKASGEPALNHSPVEYFLRAQGAALLEVAPPEIQEFTGSSDPEVFPQGDEETENLKEPFDKNGDSMR